MTPLNYDDVLNYLSRDEYDGGLPTRDFNQVWSLFLPLLEKLQYVATDQAMTNLALHLNDGLRTWLQRLAQAANRIDEAGMVAAISEDAYHAHKEPRFGAHNPEQMDVAFWKLMIQQNWRAWDARTQFDRAFQAHLARLFADPPSTDTVAGSAEEKVPVRAEQSPPYECGGAVWSSDRFGRSCTRLPDGRVIWIAGEHEDSYDPDFYIYNDVIVIHPDLSIDIYGYPRAIFPPTDFHTATLVGDQIYIIGCLGYHGTRQPGITPVYRLDCQTYQIEPVATQGDNPGWIYKHQAEYSAEKHAIKITQGEIFLNWEGKQQFKQNRKTYWLDLATGEWSGGQRKRSKEDGK